MKFPLAAIVSVLHRLAGLYLFLLIPCMLLALQYSLTSPQGFATVQYVFQNAVVKVVIWFLLSALAHHFFAGIRHLLMDTGIGESLRVATFTAWLVTTISVVLFILIGVWLWV